jgi:hypothetical protein
MLLVLTYVLFTLSKMSKEYVPLYKQFDRVDFDNDIVFIYTCPLRNSRRLCISTSGKTMVVSHHISRLERLNFSLKMPT